MLELFLAPEMVPFVGALAAVGAIGLLELAAILVFGPIFSHMHIDAHPDIDGSAEGLLSWLHVGKVPFMVLLVLFLSGFGLAGAAVQIGLDAFGLGLADAIGVAVPAIGVGIASVRRIGGLFAKALGDDPTALSVDSFVGETARIQTGTARFQSPAEARFDDKFGRAHYVMVEPADGSDSFDQGTEVILGARTEIGFQAKRKTKVIN